MAFIGNTVQNQGFTPAIDYFNGNGVTVTFTLSRPIASVAQVIVAIDNVIQNPSSSFTVAGNAITFSSAPLSGTNNIWVEYTSLITTYQGISQDPTVIGDIRATGGYLAEGDFGNSFVDGAILDYVTGNGRITVGDLDGLIIYNGGTSARARLLSLTANGALGVGTSPSYGTAGQVLTSAGSGAAPTWAAPSAPQTTVYTSGSGTYTTPANCRYLVVECVGAGGGGGGISAAGATGGNTTFGAVTGNGGSYGNSPNGGPTNTGGGASGGDINTTGSGGGYGEYGASGDYGSGGVGGSSVFGGGGIGGSPTGGGGNGSNGGGGGGGGGNVSQGSGQGGGAGGYARKTITSPAATYSYSVGAGGSGGAGTGAGGAGGAGLIIVTAYF